VEQKELDFLEAERSQWACAALKRVTHDVCENLGFKTVADASKVSMTSISQGCANLRSLDSDAVVVAARLDPQARIQSFFAGLRGHVLTTKQTLTPEQENDALRRALRNVLGPEAAALVLKHAGVE
jgi:hypothetical protein